MNVEWDGERLVVVAGNDWQREKLTKLYDMLSRNPEVEFECIERSAPSISVVLTASAVRVPAARG